MSSLKDYFDRLRDSETKTFMADKLFIYVNLLEGVREIKYKKKFAEYIINNNAVSDFRIKEVIEYIKENVEYVAKTEDFKEICQDFDKILMKEEYLSDILEGISRDLDFYGKPH